MFAAFALLMAIADPAPASDAQLARIAALYDEVCLKTFPDDQALDALMAAKNASPLSDAAVKVTLRDDPGRGWTINDAGGRVLVILELPPFHACSVRFPVPAASADDGAYRAVADRYLAAHPGFVPQQVYDRDLPSVHLHALAEMRPLPEGGADSLMVVDQTPIAAPAGTPTAIDRRYVHQFAPPPPGGS